MSLREAASTGNRLATLEQLRDYLANAIESCESMRDLAALSGRLQAILTEIEALAPPEKKGDSIDEVAARRASRGSGTGTGQARTADDAR